MTARRAFLAAAMGVLAMPFTAQAGSKVTLRWKLFASEEMAENGNFLLDGDGDSESITLSANGYLVDYLKGSVGHRLLITMEPLP